MIVLDASALLAFLFRERGHEQVAEYLPDSLMSTVNMSEVIGRFVRDGHDAQAVVTKLNSSPVRLLPFSANHAAIAAMLLPDTRPLGLSLADRACLAVSLERGLTAVTADKAWLNLNLGLPIVCIR